MNQKLEDEINEVVRLITIEKRLGKTSITKEDADFVKALADKKRYPRAEYVMGMMYLKGIGVDRHKEQGIQYLLKSSEHASYDVQLKVAYVFHVLGEFKHIPFCLERAIEDSKYFKNIY